MKKKIDAVEMVREIRNEIYDELKDKTDEEQINLFNKKAVTLHEILGIKKKINI